MSIDYPTVTAIIPTMNRMTRLKTCLTSLYTMEYPENKLRVLVINNGSSDNTKPMLSKEFSNVEIINLTKNIGFAPALNLAINKLHSKYAFITNDDVTFDSKCLKELVRLAESATDIAITGGKMYLTNKPNELAIQGFKMNLWFGYQLFDFKGQEEIRDIDVVTGGCMLIKRSLFKTIGLFDEAYFFSGEDFDFCYRTKKAGFKIKYSPRAIVWHELINTSKKILYFKQLSSHYRGKFRFMLIHANLIQILFFFACQFSLGPLYSYIQSRKTTIFPMIDALAWNLIKLPNIISVRFCPKYKKPIWI